MEDHKGWFKFYKTITNEYTFEDPIWLNARNLRNALTIEIKSKEERVTRNFKTKEEIVYPSFSYLAIKFPGSGLVPDPVYKLGLRDGQIADLLENYLDYMPDLSEEVAKRLLL